MTTKSGTQRDDDLALPLIGTFLLIMMGALLVLDFLPELWAQYFYVEGGCLLLDKRLVEHPPSGKAFNSTYRPEFLIRYKVAGQEYQAWAYKAVKSSSALRWPKERVLESFTVGQEYPCWYDPADPSRVVVVQGYSWFSCVVMPVFVVLAFLTAMGFRRALRRARCPAPAALPTRPATHPEAITTSPGPTSQGPPRPVGVTARPHRRGWGQGHGDD
jgi:hypothetical protein